MYIDVAMLEEMKSKAYHEDLMKVKEELRLERQAKVEADQALVDLKTKSEHILSSKRGAWVVEQTNL
ncbi:hypothetical protein TB1_037298 [Malus domestica]